MYPVVGTVRKVMRPAATPCSDWPRSTRSLVLDVVDEAVVDEHVDDVVELAQREEHFLGDHRAQQRRQEQLLALDAAVVTVGLGGHLAGPHVVQRGVPVDHLAAGVGQHGAELVVLQRGGAAHLDAAERVDHLGEPGEVDRHEPVDGQARQLLDDLDQTLGAAEGDRPSSAWSRCKPRRGRSCRSRRRRAGRTRRSRGSHGSHSIGVDVQVTRKRHRHNAFAVGGDVDQHHGVGARAAGVASVSPAPMSAFSPSRLSTPTIRKFSSPNCALGPRCRAIPDPAPRPG